MNRTDRLYALVEELRAVAPRPRSAPWLADRFEVSVRTVERDISALQQSGVPIWAEPGRTGGYCLDKARTLPPVNLTPSEAVAMAVALRRLDGTPFRSTAGSALRKLVAAMQGDDAAAAHDLAGRVLFLGPSAPSAPSAPGGPEAPGVPGDPAGPGEPVPAPVPRVIADAMAARRVLRIAYGDRDGAVTMREVEPMGYVSLESFWYLLAWCRLRDAARAFRTDRIRSVSVTAEVPAPRALQHEHLERAQRLSLS
jgi:predicted DNA-binding transcriptional regulator YafY